MRVSMGRPKDRTGAQDVVSRSRPYSLHSSGPLRVEAQVEIVHDEGCTGDAGTDNLELRGDDPCERRHGESGDRDDIHEHYAVERRDDPGSEIPEQDAAKADDETHVEKIAITSDRFGMGMVCEAKSTPLRRALLVHPSTMVMVVYRKTDHRVK